MGFSLIKLSPKTSIKQLSPKVSSVALKPITFLKPNKFSIERNQQIHKITSRVAQVNININDFSTLSVWDGYFYPTIGGYFAQ